MAEDDLKSVDISVFETALKLFDETDSFRACEKLDALGEPVFVAKVYSDFVRWLYDKKQVAAMIVMGRAGIQFSLKDAKRLESTDKEQSLQLKGHAKTIAYNISSNLWPGWNEEGIPLTKSDVAVGFDLARLNLRLGRELERGPLPLGNAYWLLGAHELAAGKSAEAERSFNDADREFTEAKKEDFVLMAQGYAALAAKATNTSPGDERLREVLDQLQKRGSEDAKFFADQIRTAEKLLLKQ